MNSPLQNNIMANTYTQLYIHIIFAVKGRESLIAKQHKEALYQCITRIITHKKQGALPAIFGKHVDKLE